ncbi:MAG: toxin, partial [Cyanobacteria bacterium J06635_15]
GGSPVATVKGGGSTASKVATAVGTVAQVAADILDTSANITGLFAGYERRSDGWKLERDQAEFEIQQIDKQIEAIDVQISSLTQDLRIHEQNIVQQQEVADFLQTKFTNQALYNWMGNRLSGIYFQTYKLAFDLAKETERAYQFEFGATDTYISFGHWDSRRKGLLAGEALLLELNQLEKSALDQDSRYLEITKPISLARLDPLALIDLKTTGRCQFSLGELLFDRDFPGHYFRIIKAVSLSIPAIVGPYQTVKATLTQTGHKTLLAPDIEGVNYLLGESDTIPGSIRADWRANQQIALSTGVDDSGVFELNFNDDRYLPFEGTGAVSNWLLEMPLSTNAIDFDTISDVVINLRYMCKTDGGKFKQDVMDHPTVKAFSGTRLFSVAHEFAAQWHAFQNDDLDVDTLTLTLPPNAFPPNVNVDLGTVQIQLLLGLDSGGNLVDVADGFTDASNQAIPPLTLDTSGPTPRFTFQARNNFNKTAINNLLVIVSYDGQLR